MKRKNPVAKFQRRYNKAKVFKDRKREEKKNPKTYAEYVEFFASSYAEYVEMYASSYAEYMEIEKNNGV